MNVPQDEPIRPQGQAPSQDALLERVLELIRFLRVRCAWDAAQTPQSLLPYLLEETHEVAEAVTDGDDDELATELGDLLLHVGFQIVLAEERAAFHADTVVARLEDKMRRRHPHLYGGDLSGDPVRDPGGDPATDLDSPSGSGSGSGVGSDPGSTSDSTSGSTPGGARGSGAQASATGEGAAGRPKSPAHPGTAASWEALKARERAADSILAGLARGLDPLSRAHRIQERVSAVGFDWDDARGAFEKVAEEVEEVRRALEAEPSPALEEELGDLLFSVVNLARLAGTHAMQALGRANRKFTARFTALEKLASQRGVELGSASLEQLDALWDEVKRGAG